MRELARGAAGTISGAFATGGTPAQALSATSHGSAQSLVRSVSHSPNANVILSNFNVKPQSADTDKYQSGT